MSTPVPAILGIFTVAGLSLIVTGCEPLENVLKVANNGQPMPGGPSQSALYVSPSGDSGVPVVEVALETVAAAEPCVVPAHLFRSMQCDEGGQLIPIR
jgi:hypothetical protein